MIIKGYSLDQVANSLLIVLDSLKRGRPYRREESGQLHYYSGRELSNAIYSSGGITVPPHSKFAYYLKQRSSTNTYGDILDYPHPLAISIYENYRPQINIFDVGKLSQIVSGQDPEVLMMRLPPMLRTQYVLPPQDLNPREFELHEGDTGYSQNLLQEVAALMRLS
ncbi:hypothetical protein HYV89_00780 [Candidatus Woesearchaeota archaeon]|nr:hypothetical protein [Candidatus Woesearchaeota archaeon]